MSAGQNSDFAVIASLPEETKMKFMESASAILLNIYIKLAVSYLGVKNYQLSSRLLFCIWEALERCLLSRRNDWPSSLARLCWGRLKSWWHTQTEGTPQISTSCTGRTACSLACISSAAWRWWQSRYRPSVWWQDKQNGVWFSPIGNSYSHRREAI